jgi:translation initiation factor 1 (eIF-1/SUI1)
MAPCSGRAATHSRTAASTSTSPPAPAAAAKPAKAPKPVVPKIFVEVNERGRKKQITTISGLDAYGVKLKDAASALGKKFGAGASVTKSASNPNVMEIDVQVRRPGAGATRARHALHT